MTLAQVHRKLVVLVAFLAFGAATGAGFTAGLLVDQPLQRDALDAQGINNCVTAVKASLVLLDPDSIVAFEAAEIAELRTLPPRCSETEIRRAIEADYPALLARLQTIGSGP